MTFTHTVWAAEVATAANLPDERLENRLTAILVATLEHPSASIPQAMDGDEGQAKFGSPSKDSRGGEHRSWASCDGESTGSRTKPVLQPLPISLMESPSGTIASTSTGSGKSGPVITDPTWISSVFMVLCT